MASAPWSEGGHAFRSRIERCSDGLTRSAAGGIVSRARLFELPATPDPGVPAGPAATKTVLLRSVDGADLTFVTPSIAAISDAPTRRRFMLGEDLMMVRVNGALTESALVNHGPFRPEIAGVARLGDGIEPGE